MCCRWTQPLHCCTGSLQLCVEIALHLSQTTSKSAFNSYFPCSKRDNFSELAEQQVNSSNSQNKTLYLLSWDHAFGWKMAMNISPDLRPQKTIPGSSTTHSETCRKKKEKKKFKQTGICRLCDHYWIHVGFKNIFPLQHLYVISIISKSCTVLSLMGCDVFGVLQNLVWVYFMLK